MLLANCAKTGKGNILEFAVEAARARASVGEISMALEDAWGRHVAETQMVSGSMATHLMMMIIMKKCA